MTSEDKKRLEEMQVEARTTSLSEKERWLIARLGAEAQENERLQQELQDRRVAEMDRLENLTNRAEAAEAERDAIREEWTRVFATLREERDAAEATCQSLLDQSSRWEAQALEAGVCIAELEAKCREYEKFFASIARAYGEGPISNTSES